MCLIEDTYCSYCEHYEQAAQLGDADAQNNLGVVCANGRSVESDLKTARELWTKAAAQGSYNSCWTETIRRLGRKNDSNTAFWSFTWHVSMWIHVYKNGKQNTLVRTRIYIHVALVLFVIPSPNFSQTPKMAQNQCFHRNRVVKKKGLNRLVQQSTRQTTHIFSPTLPSVV